MRLILVPLLLTLLVPAARAAHRPVVVGSVEPLSMVLRELYGNRARVVTLLSPNQSPHHPMLSPGQVLTLRKADLVVWLGPDADPSVAPLVARRAGPSLALTALPGVTVRHTDVDEDGELRPGGVDPHLWLDPDNMAALARVIAARDGARLAPGEPAAFLQRLKAAEAGIHRQLAPVSSVPWLTYHQPWAYFQHRFGLAAPVIVSRQLGAGPGTRQFVALAGQIKQRGVHCAIIEPEAQARMMARLCPDCVRRPLDPLGRDHAGERYASWLAHTVAPAFRQCLAGH